MSISATDLYNFKSCRYRPYLDFNGDPDSRTKIHPLIQLLWEAGSQHEDKMYGEIRSANPDKTFKEISPKSPASKNLFEETRAAMKLGFDFIYQGVLMTDEFVGRPDLLIKQSGGSALGNYHYYPMDIKLAQTEDEWDDGKEKMKIEHLWQLFFYGQLLRAVQGVCPERGCIYKSERRQLFAGLRGEPKNYGTALELLKKYMSGDSGDVEPAISSKCGLCHWQVHCKSWAEENRDSTLLFYVGDSFKTGIRELGIRSIEDLANQDLSSLVEKVKELKLEGFFWKSMPDSLVEDAVRRAKVFLDGKHVFRARPDFPESDVEIHYDIEDDPTRDFVYLHGILLAKRGSEPEYIPFFTDSEDEEEQKTKELFELFAAYPDAPVYHYAPHEKTTLKRLIEKYPSLDSSIFESLFGEHGRAIDLFQWIKKNSDWPLTSYSLKAICKYLGFKWDAEDAGGANSIIWMNDYLNGQVELKDKILKYNGDDVRATWFLKAKLCEHVLSSSGPS